MTRFVSKTAIAAAALAATASVGLALPASADTASHHASKSARIHAHHAAIRSSAYRVGYRQGWHDGHVAAAAGEVPADVRTGRSAAIDPAYDGGVLGNGGILGTGVLGGRGVLGTGVLDGQGALGIGVLGF